MSTTRFRVPAMDCATEKTVIENRLARIEGVHARFDLIDRIVTVDHGSLSADVIEAALDDIGMAPERLPSDTRAPAVEAERAWWKSGWMLALSGALAIAAESIAWASGDESSWTVIVLSLAAMASGGPSTFRKAFAAARTLTLNINLLMVIAVIGAMCIGQWPEAAMVTFLFAVAELVEARSVQRAGNAIRALMALAPETAHLKRGPTWVEVPASEVTPGAIIRVPPGERVPLDGRISDGATAIDQAPITGESVPVERGVGDAVFAGTINTHALIEVEVVTGQGDSTLARIGRTIREAQSQKAPTERFVDAFARWYTPAVVLLALVVAIVPPIVLGEAFGPWVYKALVMLVIACPCALVISTPVTIVSGLAAAARMGLVVKGGVHLEQARKLRAIALDKTGTLTLGKPSLTDVVPLGELDRDQLLQHAASLEATSTHPIAKAVASAYHGDHLVAGEVRNVPGKGLSGVVGGLRISIGSHRMIEEAGLCRPEVERELERLEAEGKSVMVVWTERGVLGVLAVADTVRATSVEAIRALHAQDVAVVMLTGDNPTTANAVAKQVGIDAVEANLRPEDKLAAIDRLTTTHGAMGMVGDGVNDAPALARATIGFAMGAAGTDTALETADVALMRDDLRGVPQLIALSRRTARTLALNIALALVIKLVFFVLALMGIATLWMAVFADMGASLVVALNGLSLLRFGHRKPTEGSD